MQTYHSWIPSKRTDIIIMAKNWNAKLEANAAKWLIGEQTITGFSSLISEAEIKLNAAMSADRSKIITEQCNLVFAELVSMMREIKDRFFHAPPLNPDDLVSLGLKLRGNASPIGIPDIMPEITIRSIGLHRLDLYLGPQTGAVSTDKRSLDSFEIRMGLLPSSGSATPEDIVADRRLIMKTPSRPEDLPWVSSTHRRRHHLDFNLDDSGKLFYVCGCYRNPKEEEGPWCAILSRLVP